MMDLLWHCILCKPKGCKFESYLRSQIPIFQVGFELASSSRNRPGAYKFQDRFDMAAIYPSSVSHNGSFRLRFPLTPPI